MPFRLAPRAAGAVVAALVLLAPPLCRAQAPQNAAPATPPAPSSPGAPDQPAQPFGEDATLAAKTIVYVKGSGNWDKAFDIIGGALKKVKIYLDKEGIKPDGLPMTIFTATDDAGFDYEAAIPIAAVPKNPPRGDLAVGTSPEGHALKFVHHGSYDDLDNFYEAVTNYLDDKRLVARDMFIEEYVTDPTTADPNKLVVNVYVLIKSSDNSPG